MRGFPWSVRDEIAKTGFAYDCYSFNDLGKIDLSRYRVVVFPGLFVMTTAKERVLREKICRDGRTVVWYFAPGISDGKTLDATRVERLTGCQFGGDKVAERDFPGWKSVYVPNYEKSTLDAERFAILLKETGAHSYVDFPSVVHANKLLVSVHLKDGGKRVLRLPRRVAKVTELISGRVVAEGTNSFEYEFMSPDTRIFEVEN